MASTSAGTATIEVCVTCRPIEALRLSLGLHASSCVLLVKVLVRDRALRVLILIFVSEFHLYVEWLRGQVLCALLPNMLRQALSVDVV